MEEWQRLLKDGVNNAEQLFERFGVDKELAERAKKMVPGDPMDPKTRLGAISSMKQLETDLRYIATAKKEGATLVEYILLAVLIGVAAITGMTLLGKSTSNKMNNIAAAVG